MSDASVLARATEAANRPAPVRVLLVDDSALVRTLVGKRLQADPGIELVGTAANGLLALQALQRRPVDVVILDVEMPVMDGLSALPRIVAEHRGARVLMLSSLTRRNAEISLRALQLGATDYIAKPDGGDVDAFERELIAKVKGLGRPRPRATPVPAAPASSPRPSIARCPDVLAIGGSTGAPPVLLRLFQELRGRVRRQPILITQHMPPTFTALLAEQLARAGDRPCAEGRDGEVVVPGHAYVAPGGWHMTVAREGVQRVIRLNQDAPENHCRPAVDPMLRSVAQTYGRGAMAVILTGMGADGALGCQAVAQAGGRFVVQDEASSVVWGMPGAAARTGLAERVLPLSDIAGYLAAAAEIAA
jgi:two-component system, chemotaxis family, protein-glutamate methylesterase/glutaminase